MYHNLFIYLFCLFVFLGPHPCMAYGGSQARGWIRAIAASLGNSVICYTLATYCVFCEPATGDPSHICDLCHSSQQHRILNPLSKARDRTRILMDVSGVH